MRSFRYAVTGQLDQAIAEALSAWNIQQETQLTDEWNPAVPLMLLRVYPWLEDIQAVECEATAALATPSIPEPAKLVLVRGAQAVTWLQAGRLAEAAAAAQAAAAAAGRLGFDHHFFAVDHLRALAGLTLSSATSTPPSGSPSKCFRYGAAASSLRVPGPAGPGRDLGSARAGP
jgi:hypothetical protein